MDALADTPEKGPALGVDTSKKRPRRRKPRHRRTTRPQLLTRDQLYLRTNAAKLFDQIVAGVIADLGGEGNITTVQRYLIEAFAGQAISVDDFNARKLMGQEIDVLKQCHVVSTMVRTIAYIGTGRVSRDVTPSLNAYLPREAVE
jgi:hypothetical protein